MLRNHIKLVWVRPFDLNDISIGINFLLEGEVGVVGESYFSFLK